METNLNVMIDDISPDRIEEEINEPEDVGNDDLSFKCMNGKLYEVAGEKLIIIANFCLSIKSRSLLVDDARNYYLCRK